MEAVGNLNGSLQSGMIVNREEAVNIAQNYLSGNALGGEAPAERNLANSAGTITGYLSEVYQKDFDAIYSRSLGKVIIDKPAGDTWKNWFTIEGEETGFQKALETLTQKLSLKRTLYKADNYQRRYGYSIILIGLRGQDVSEPLVAKGDVEYLRVFHKYDVNNTEYYLDTGNPLYGTPETFIIDYTTSTGTEQIRIHSSRCIVIAEDYDSLEIEGRSALLPSLNYIQALENNIWATSEGLFQRVVPPFLVTFDHKPTDDLKNDLETQLDGFKTGVRQRIMTHGIKIEPMTGAASGNFQSGVNVMEFLMKLIAGTTGIPMRILRGAEAGALASAGTDRETWHEWIGNRQKNFGEEVLKKFITKMQDLSLLPTVEYEVIWHPLSKPDGNKEAEIWVKRADAAQRLSGIVDPEVIQRKVLELAEEDIKIIAPPPVTVAPPQAAQASIAANQPLSPSSPINQKLMDDYLDLEGQARLTSEFKMDVEKAIMDFEDQAIAFIKKNITPEIEANSEEAALAKIDKFKLKRSKLESITYDHTTKLFVYGGQNAYTVMEASTAYEIGDPLAIKFLKKNSLIVADKLTKEVEGALRFDLMEGIRTGDGWKSIERKARKTGQGYLKRSDVYARTESSKAVNEGRLNGYSQLGVEIVTGVMIQGLARPPSDPCPAEIDGVRFTLEDARNKIPRHPQCQCTWIASTVYDKEWEGL